MDAKDSVKCLLALRRRELARLSYDSGGRAQDLERGDARFELALMNMPAEEVTGCFDGALVLYDENAGGPSRSGSWRRAASGTSLPGQIASPRLGQSASLRSSARVGSARHGIGAAED